MIPRKWPSKKPAKFCEIFKCLLNNPVNCKNISKELTRKIWRPSSRRFRRTYVKDVGERKPVWCDEEEINITLMADLWKKTQGQNLLESVFSRKVLGFASSYEK
ncbi:unnamed protein product [Moneuplotes crassus]|uniref:Uncharacterized protein n=1 Tax=Euplotes crassus TaxID=5936 RepID=A0AAD1UBE3_EUPCR|nr:unnamed protein product [Moneuplotes crassus]